jgi:NADPH:quinone reductase-like Zn-dependent oxidoreductase
LCTAAPGEWARSRSSSAYLGGHVTATGRGADDGFVRSLGAERFVSTADGRLEEKVSGVDVVIDTVGGAVLDASYELMRAGGRLVTLSAPPSQERAKQFGVHAMFFVVTPDPAALARLASLVDDGQLRPIISQSFPLSEGRRAFESGAHPRPPGKTVLIVR